MLKRVFLFVLTNIAIMVMVSIVMAVLGQLGLLDLAGGQSGLLVLCVVWGMGASIVSLLMSRQIAKWSLGVQLVDGRTGNADLDWLYNTVGQLAQQANLPMPQVGFYDSPEVNAFATGPSKNRSLVAVSTGLLQGDGQAGDRGRARPRADARRQRRHGHDDADPGRRERVRALPVAHRGARSCATCCRATTSAGRRSWDARRPARVHRRRRSCSACSAR